MADLSCISIGGYECDICCDECGETLSSGDLAELVAEAERHVAEHGPKVEERKRLAAEAQRKNAEARAEWAKELGREPSDAEWRIEYTNRMWRRMLS